MVRAELNRDGVPPMYEELDAAMAKRGGDTFNVAISASSAGKGIGIKAIKPKGEPVCRVLFLRPERAILHPQILAPTDPRSGVVGEPWFMVRRRSLA